jgi:hypothetical protein
LGNATAITIPTIAVTNIEAFVLFDKRTIIPKDLNMTKSVVLTQDNPHDPTSD